MSIDLTSTRPRIFDESSDKKDEWKICCVEDIQIAAKLKLPRDIYEYLASGTDNEVTIKENRIAFDRWFIRPRMMRSISNLSTQTTITFPKTNTTLQLSFPVFVSPAGVHALCDPEYGECATIRACDDAGILFGLSQHSTRTIEQVAETSPNAMKWYQAYILKERNITEQLIKRAINNGYTGIFLTVDSIRFGYREADSRNGFNSLPPPHRLVNYDDTVSNLPGHTSNSGDLQDTYNSKKHSSWDQNSELMFDTNVTWDDVKWIKQIAGPNIPVIIKGIMTSEDAILAVNAGTDGIMVSNHGGRQQDGCLATIDVLPEIVSVVPKHIPILLDGGIRRGTDIYKALALGASAVGIGKPVFFSLAVDGENGVKHMLQLLRKEFEAVMALTGCETVHDITSNHITKQSRL